MLMTIPLMLEKLVKIPTILLVDDDADFTAGGFHIMLAQSGFEALSCLQISRPSVILLDFNMPGMDGAETLQAIHGIDPKIPVIYGNRDRSPGTSAASSGARGRGIRSETGGLEIAPTDIDLCVGTVACWCGPARDAVLSPPLLMRDRPVIPK